MSTSMATIPQIKKALAAVATVEEAKELRDQASALQKYAKQAKDRLDVQNHACYVKLLCERRAGELLRGIERMSRSEAGAARGRSRGDRDTSGYLATLRRAGIPESTAREWQALAACPEESLLYLLKICNEGELEMTSLMALNNARTFLEEEKEREREAREQERFERAKPVGPVPTEPTASRVVKVVAVTPHKGRREGVPSDTITGRERSVGVIEKETKRREDERIQRAIDLLQATKQLLEGVPRLKEIHALVSRALKLCSSIKE